MSPLPQRRLCSRLMSLSPLQVCQFRIMILICLWSCLFSFMFVIFYLVFWVLHFMHSNWILLIDICFASLIGSINLNENKSLALDELSIHT
jgi:hypothetical protein